MKKPSLTQIFIYSSLISFVVLSVLALLVGTGIDVDGDPNVVLVNYQFYARKLWQINLLQYFVLTAIAAIVHYRRGQMFFYLPGMLLFMFFANYHYIYQSAEFFQYKKAVGIDDGAFEVGFLIGIFQSITIFIATGLAVLSIYLLRKRTKDRA